MNSQMASDRTAVATRNRSRVRRLIEFTSCKPFAFSKIHAASKHFNQPSIETKRHGNYLLRFKAQWLVFRAGIPGQNNCGCGFAAWPGKVWFVAGLVMGTGQWPGARAGSRMVITRGTKFIRPIFLSMVALITLKMIYDNFLKPHA
jgi:hypothetical protein